MRRSLLVSPLRPLPFTSCYATLSQLPLTFTRTNSNNSTTSSSQSPPTPAPTTSISSTKGTAQRRTRSPLASKSLSGSGVPTLRDWLLRSDVISLYRQCVKTVRTLPNDQRREIVDHIRHSFTQWKYVIFHCSFFRPLIYGSGSVCIDISKIMGIYESCWLMVDVSYNASNTYAI
jgi:hypothetical protein